MTDEIFLETPISAGMRLESGEFFEIFFDRTDEIVHIFSDENFEYERFSRCEEFFCYFEDRKIELDRSILVDSRHAGGCRGNVRCYEIERIDSDASQVCVDFFVFEDALLQEEDVRISEIRIDFLNVYPDGFSSFSDRFCDDLQKTSWSGSDIEDFDSRFENAVFFFYFEKFEGTAGAISEFFCLEKVWILNLKRFCHGIF